MKAISDKMANSRKVFSHKQGYSVNKQMRNQLSLMQRAHPNLKKHHLKRYTYLVRSSISSVLVKRKRLQLKKTTPNSKPKQNSNEASSQPVLNTSKNAEKSIGYNFITLEQWQKQGNRVKQTHSPFYTPKKPKPDETEMQLKDYKWNKHTVITKSHEKIQEFLEKRISDQGPSRKPARYRELAMINHMLNEMKKKQEKLKRVFPLYMGANV